MSSPESAASDTLGETQKAAPPLRPSGEHLPRGTPIGRYLVLDVLGRGGMSVVLAAYDPELDRKVAVKLVRPELEGGAEATARLLREAQAMARVRHPNVATVYDAGTWEGRVFLAMELVDGGTLRSWAKEKPRPLREVVKLFLSAGEGLAAAHAAGLVHRDFKPDNVLVGRDGRPRVTDFGLVRPANGAAEPASSAASLVPIGSRPDSGEVLTEAGAVLGTPAYMAPEQLLGKVADAQADQFAFAVALYEALYGERPFEAKDFQSTFDAVTKGHVRPPPAGARVPGWLRRVLLRALSVEPSARYPSMAALLAALRSDPIARLKRLALVAGVVLLALSGPAFVAWDARREAQRCQATASELVGIWDAERAAALERVFTAAQASPTAWTRVRDWAERYAGSWHEARLLACQGERGAVEDARLVAASNRCVQARRLQFKAVLELLSVADAETLSLSERVFSSVGDPRACVGRLETVRASTNGEDGALVEQLARARARILLTSLDAGEQDAREALQQAKDRGRDDLAAAALFEVARAYDVRGQARPALQAYREALLTAEATGESELAFEIRLSLSQLLAEDIESYDEALWVLEEAGATARQLALPPERLVKLAFRKAIVLEQADRPTEGLVVAEQALALGRAQQLSPADLAPTLQALGNLNSDLGHEVVASRYYEDFIAAERTTSLRLVDYVVPYSYSGELLVLTGELERGLQRLQEARAALRPFGGHAQHAVLLDAWLAFTAASLGREADARAWREQALAHRGELKLPHHVAELLQMVAWVDIFLGEPSQALKELEAAEAAILPAAAVNRRALLDLALCEAEVLRRLGKPAEAATKLEAALRQAEASETLVDVSLAQARALLVELQLARGEVPAAEATAVMQEALQVLERDVGAENAELAVPLVTQGRLAVALGRTADARVAFERAVAVAARRLGDVFELAEARFALAQVTGDRAMAEEAKAGLGKLKERVPLERQVSSWLALSPTLSPSGRGSQ